MPGFAAAHARRERKHPGNRCSIARIREAMSVADRDDLDAVLADLDGETSSGIAATLRDLGHDVTHTTVSRHRRQDCRCPRGEQ